MKPSVMDIFASLEQRDRERGELRKDQQRAAREEKALAKQLARDEAQKVAKAAREEKSLATQLARDEAKMVAKDEAARLKVHAKLNTKKAANEEAEATQVAKVSGKDAVKKAGDKAPRKKAGDKKAPHKRPASTALIRFSKPGYSIERSRGPQVLCRTGFRGAEQSFKIPYGENPNASEHRTEASAVKAAKLWVQREFKRQKLT